MKYIGLSQIARREKLVRVAGGIAVAGLGASFIAAALEFNRGAPDGTALVVAGMVALVAGLIYMYAIIRYTN